MSFADKINNLIGYSLVKIWTADVKTKERLLGAKVKGGLGKVDGQRTLKLTCKQKGEVLWQIDLTGTWLELAEGLTKIDDKGERPAISWYKANAPKVDTP